MFTHAEVRPHDITPIKAQPGRRGPLGGLGNLYWASGATSDGFISCTVSWWTTTDATSRMPRDRETSMFDFLLNSHDGLSGVGVVMVVVSAECFLAGDVMHVVNCKRWLIGEQRVVCHVSLPQHSKNLWLLNHLIWHSEHFNGQKSLTPALVSQKRSGKRLIEQNIISLYFQADWPYTTYILHFTYRRDIFFFLFSTGYYHNKTFVKYSILIGIDWG